MHKAFNCIIKYHFRAGWFFRVMSFEYRYHITIQLGFIFPDKLKVSDNSIRKFDFENVPFDNSYTHGLIHWFSYLKIPIIGFAI